MLRDLNCIELHLYGLSRTTDAAMKRQTANFLVEGSQPKESRAIQRAVFDTT